MKARVKINNEIIDVLQVGTKTHLYDIEDIEFLDNPQDYWTRLEHQYAGMAMQGLMTNSVLAAEFRKDPNNGIEDMSNTITKAAVIYATALVEKLKEKEERK